MSRQININRTGFSSDEIVFGVRLSKTLLKIEKLY